MATAMTNNNRSNHSSGSTTPTHLLQVPSTTSTSSSHRGLLPFPTSPSLPDRRSRLRRLKISLATQESTDNSYDHWSPANSIADKSQWRSSISTDSSIYVGADLVNNWDKSDIIAPNGTRRRKYRDLPDDQISSWSKSKESKRVHSEEVVSNQERTIAAEHQNEDLLIRLGPPVLPPVNSSEKANLGCNGTVNTARSHRRNIITPRNYHITRGTGNGSDNNITFPSHPHLEGHVELYRPRKESKEVQLQKQETFKDAAEKGEEREDKRKKDEKEEEEDADQREENKRFRLPNIRLRKSSPPLHEDFFLTSIDDYEDISVKNNRRSSTISKESGKVKDKEEKEEMSRDKTSSKDDNDVIATSSPPHEVQNSSPSTDNQQPPLTPADTETVEEMTLHDISSEEPELPELAEHHSSLKDKEPVKQNKSLKEKDSVKQNNAESVSPSSSTSRIPVPVTSSRESRDTPRESRGSPPDTKGLQRVYLEGLDYMRGHVTTIEEEMEKIDREFHKILTSSGEDRMFYLKECNERLLQANSELRKNDVSLEVIDSSTRLVRLLNKLRSMKSPVDKDLVDFLTHFWDHSKSTTEQLKALLIKFNTTVLERLSNNYITSHSADLKVPICQQYALDIEDFLKDLGQQLSDADTLIKSYDGGIHQNLLDSSDFSEQLMLMCDLNAFPILGFVQAASLKISLMCQKARQWLARDEKFMHEINTFIKETRSVARRREMALQNEKEKQKRREKNVKIAQSMLHNNREKLGMIERELKELEDKLSGSKVEQKQKAEEIHQKETMVDFLKLTLQQTKRNYSLQSKRSKLLRQVQELENYLKTMENELETVQDMILAKSHEKILLREKIHNSEQSYESLKTGLDKFSENLEKLEADVTSLSGQLLHLEIVNTIRTSPETLDNLIDRPSTVKLSQSLKEKIRDRKKKAAMKNS